MDTRLTGSMPWNRYLRGAALVIGLLLLSFHPAFSATKPAERIVINDGKEQEQFMSTLASMPYTATGTGPVLYALECSTCPQTQAFEKDWKGRLDGVEIRRIFFALSEKTANEAAHLARTRDINEFYAFMTGTKVAPPIKACNCPKDNAAIEAYNSVTGPLHKVLMPVILKNGYRKEAAVPQFMWESDGRVYVSGYSKRGFPDILTMLRSGMQTKEASASPPRSPANDSAATVPTPPAETTAQVMTAEKKSPESAGEVKTKANAVESGIRGPDIIGFRIGMTPSEARAMFKSRVLTSDELRRNYKETSGTLVGYPPGGQRVDVPNGRFIDSFETVGRQADGSNHGLYVRFTQTPRQERIMYVIRGLSIPEDKRPTFEVFEKTLLEKYGTPTYSDPKVPAGALFYWSYDSSGIVQKPQSIRTIGVPICPGSVDPSYLTSANFSTDLSTLTENSTLTEKTLSVCGAMLLYVVAQFPVSGYVGRNTLVSGYSTVVIAYDSTIRATKEAHAMVNKAVADAKEAEIKKAQKQKPPEF